jgi:threonine dehydratase
VAPGLAYHGSDLAIPVYLVMPVRQPYVVAQCQLMCCGQLFAPLTKVENCRSFGANVRTEGAHIGEAMVIAKKMAAEQGISSHRGERTVLSPYHILAGLTYINGYDDEAIIAGQGTCALEILEQVC